MLQRERTRKRVGARAALAVLAGACALGFTAPAQAAEPNDTFETAAGPLTAGTNYKPALTTINDADFFYFYIPNTVQASVTTANLAKPTKGPSGKTIVTSLLRGRKGKLPLPLADTARVLRPGKSATVSITLVPGKYFIPVGHDSTATEPAANVPYRLQIGPVGSTTNSFEIFARRCSDTKRKVSRFKTSKKNAAKRLAKAKRHHSSKKVHKLQEKVRSKRTKIREAQRVKRIVCSVPQ